MKTRKRKPKVQCVTLIIHAEDFGVYPANTIVGTRYAKMSTFRPSIVLDHDKEFGRLATTCFRELMREIHGKAGK